MNVADKLVERGGGCLSILEGSIELDVAVEVCITSVVPGFIVTASFSSQSSHCA